METIELLALVAAVLFFLAALRQSTSPAVEVVRAPAVAHHLLNEASDNRPNTGLFRALATWARGSERRVDSISTVAYGSHWRSLRSNLTAGFLNPSRITALAPLQRDAVQDLVAGLPVAAGEVVVIPLVETGPIVPGREGLLSRAAKRDSGGVTKVYKQ